MCAECHSSPCLPGCPNAEDPVAIYECKYCGNAITVGDLFFEINGNKYHEDCFSDAAQDILVNEFGAEMKFAEVEVHD